MTNPYAFNDFFKNSFDLNQLFATQRRNIEAISAANQAVVEGAQEIARRQAEVMRQNVENVLQCSRDMFTGGSPETSIGKQAELAKDIFQSTLENIREATETLTKVSFEAFEELSNRASEAADEFSKASGAAASSTKKKAAAA